MQEHKLVGLINNARLMQYCFHDYQAPNLAIVKHVVEHRLGDFEDFCTLIKSLV